MAFPQITRSAWVATIVILAVGCASAAVPIAAPPSVPTTASSPDATTIGSTPDTAVDPAGSAAPASASSTTAVPLTGVAAPDWLGTVTLPLRPGEDNGIAQPTPPELQDRQLWTIDHLPPPPDDVFVAALVSPPPDDVLDRSTWTEACPVAKDELAWVTVSFFGFDHRFHTGELLIHADHAEAVAGVFEGLHTMRFPIEEMRVTSQEALDAPPTGDSNNTSSFVCRPAVNSTSWSRHAHGTAVDINPFHNPYVKGDLVIPELASAYLDRDRFARGMVHAEVVALFEGIGWGWGGLWRSSSDWMHFSDTGT